MRRIMNISAASVLKEVYALRSARRPYSLRAFARDLGLSHSYVSLVLNNKKCLPVATLRSLGDKLGLESHQVLELEKNESPSKRKAKTFSQIELDKFRLMCRWYYVAILELVQLKGFAPSTKNIADYLDLEMDDVSEALSAMKRLGVIKISAGKWTCIEEKRSIVAPTSTEAIRAYHRQMALLAHDELSKIDSHHFKCRDITGMTMPINPKRISGAKRKIARFRRSLEAYLTQGECSEVYQFNLQLFPLKAAGGKSKREKRSGC